jgi:hypothetical protein
VLFEESHVSEKTLILKFWRIAIINSKITGLLHIYCISYSPKLKYFNQRSRNFDEKTSDLGTTFPSHDWTQIFIEAGTLWEEIKENRSPELEASKKRIVRCYIEARIRGDKMKIKDKTVLQDWINILYDIGRRNFDNLCLELFADVAEGMLPKKRQ